jgi:hypothetical protein
MARCRARTEDGTGPLCNRKVKKDGMRCYQHKGLPTAPPRLSKSVELPKRGTRGSARAREQARHSRAAARAARIEEKKRERIKAAADYCSDLLMEGWSETVAERAADYVSDQAWNRIFRSRGNQCKTLAQLARQALAVKDQLRDLLGSVVAWILSLIGVGAAAREFAGELATNIPVLPVDAKLIAVARGLQVTGIALCVIREENVTRCQCFVDLALAETKTQVRKILVTALGDWAQLAEFSPKEARRAA